MKNIYLALLLSTLATSLFAQNKAKTRSNEEISQVGDKIKIDQNFSDPLKGVAPKDLSAASGEELGQLKNLTVLPAEKPEFYYDSMEMMFDQGKMVLKNTTRPDVIVVNELERMKATPEMQALAIQKLSTCGVRLFENMSYKTKKGEDITVVYNCENVCWAVKSLPIQNGKFPTTQMTVLNPGFCEALWTGMIPVRGISK